MSTRSDSAALRQLNLSIKRDHKGKAFLLHNTGKINQVIESDSDKLFYTNSNIAANI